MGILSPKGSLELPLQTLTQIQATKAI